MKYLQGLSMAGDQKKMDLANRLESIDRKLVVIDERLNNHLAHHEAYLKIMMWGLGIGVPILSTVCLRIVEKIWK